MDSIVPQPGDVRSFWLQEALAADPGEPCPPLRGRVGADVCIVGGGFAGLWTAHELLDREPGLRIALLEADICGGGASGRNGGFLSSSWHDLPALCHLYGEEPGLRYAQALADQVGAVGEWCSRNRVDAWFHHEGVLGLETNPEQLGAHAEALELSRRLGLDVMQPLGVDETRRYVDSPAAVGGVFVRDNAIVQPARLARGLRRVALERGVHIFEGTRVGALDHRRPAVVSTGAGAVRADHVVLTIGAWATGWPGFRTRLGNIADYVVATEPIPDRLREIGWTSGVGIADARDMLYYLRPTDDHRIAIGGGSTGVLYGGTIGRGATKLRGVADVAARGLLYLFPQLEGVRFTHAWGGPIDMSASWTPFFRTLDPGNAHCGLGFSGHGLAATKLGGKTLASMVLGVQDEWSELPVVGDALARTPPEPLRWALVRSAVWGMGRHDRAADAGRRPGVISRALTRAPLAYRERAARDR
jgi:glycine/D-amino acid oxidase-like deaminating enzyme